jgi:hypothetical protein
MSQEVPARVLDEMMAYYRERADEYDEWLWRKMKTCPSDTCAYLKGIL